MSATAVILVHDHIIVGRDGRASLKGLRLIQPRKAGLPSSTATPLRRLAQGRSPCLPSHNLARTDSQATGASAGPLRRGVGSAASPLRGVGASPACRFPLAPHDAAPYEAPIIADTGTTYGDVYFQK
jgi:hypothetical protein